MKIKRKRKGDYLCFGLFPFTLFVSPNGNPEAATWALDSKTNKIAIAKAEERAFKRIYNSGQSVSDKVTVNVEEINQYMREHNCNMNRAALAFVPKDASKKVARELAKKLKIKIDSTEVIGELVEIKYSSKIISL